MQKCTFYPRGINSTKGGRKKKNQTLKKRNQVVLQTAVFEEQFDRDRAR